MTDTDILSSGEDRLRKRRLAWWRYFALGLAGSVMTGLVSGYLAGAYENGTIPVWLPVIGCVVVMVLMGWMTRDYFRRIDELDLMDNLWAHLFGLYGGFLLFGGWFFFVDLGLTSYPTAPAIVFAMLLLTLAAYGARKLGLR
jgi:ABC-type Mn2+/Zn2+ transport system permease subunit